MKIKLYELVLFQYGNMVPYHKNFDLFIVLMDCINELCENEQN